MANNDAKLESIKSEIRSLLVSSQNEMSIQSFLNDYKECVGKPLPFLELGFNSAIGFFKSLKDVVKVKETFNGTVLVPIESKNSSHINSLVSKQRTVKKRRGRNRYSRAKTIKQGNDTYYQTVRPRTNMYFDTLIDQDDFDSDELDNLDIVWTKDSPASEDDDLISGGSKHNEYRIASPIPVSRPQRNVSPSISSVNYSSDGETDYEAGLKKPDSSSCIKKTSLFQYDSNDCKRSFEENSSKSNNNLISSGSSLLNYDLKESRPLNTCTEKVNSPTNFKRLFPVKCDNYVSDPCPVLRPSSALQRHKASNQKTQDESFRRISPAKSKNIEDRMQFNRRDAIGRSIPSEYDSNKLSSTEQENSSSNSVKTVKSNRDSALLQPTAQRSDSLESIPSLTDEEKILIRSDNILGRPSPIKHDIHETIKTSSTFLEQKIKSNCHPALRKSILFSNDSNESENSSDKLVKDMKFDCDRTLRRTGPFDYDHNGTKTSLNHSQETEADSVYRRPSSSNSQLHSSASCVTNNQLDVLRRSTPVYYDHYETKSSLYRDEKFEADSIYRRPSSSNSQLHSSASCVTNNKSDVLRRSGPVDYDHYETKSSLYYEEETEADSVYRRPSSSNSKLHSSTSCFTNNKSDVLRRPLTAIDYDYNERETEAATSVSNNSKLYSSTSWDKSNKSDSPTSYKQCSLEFIIKKMKELCPTDNQSSLDENDLIPHNISSSDVYKFFKSKDSSAEKQDDKTSEVNVSEEHWIYLWALVNGIILDEEKIKEPCTRLLNLTKKSKENISKKDLKTISSLVDGKMLNNHFSDDSSNIGHYQINDCKNDNESNDHHKNLNQHFESVEKNICLICESKVNKCVCSKRREKLKNENEFEENSCDCAKYNTLTSNRKSEMSRYDCSKYDKEFSFKTQFSGMSRGKLFKEQLMQSERLGLSDNNPLVNLNVGRGVAIKKLLKTHPTNENRPSSSDVVLGRGYFLKHLQNKYLGK